MWKAVARWAYLYRRALLAQAAADTKPQLTSSNTATPPEGAQHRRFKNQKLGERYPFRSLNTLSQLERKLRVTEAWDNLRDNSWFVIMRLSQLKVTRQCGMALLWKKASKRWIPQTLLPNAWKSRIALWSGRDDTGVRCLLCVMHGARRNPRVYQYRSALDDHICRDHLFLWKNCPFPACQISKASRNSLISHYAACHLADWLVHPERLLKLPEYRLRRVALFYARKQTQPGSYEAMLLQLAISEESVRTTFEEMD